MTIREYTKINSKNTILNGEYYDFKELYNFYLSFKKMGKKLCKEYDLKPVVITQENNIIELKWPILSTNKSNDYTYFLPIEKYFNQLKSEISVNEIFSIAILIEEISRILKLYDYYGTEYVDSIKSKVFEIVDSINKKNQLSFEYNNIKACKELFEKIESKNPEINKMKEDLKPNDDYIMIYYNYLNLISLIMHFIKVEIMYYTSVKNAKYKPKKCIECNKIFVGKGHKCENCAKIHERIRKNKYKKCTTLKKNISNYLSVYGESIPTTIKLKASRMVEEDGNRYIYYEELNRLLNEIKKCIHKKS